ncbi:Spermidine synthase [Aliarcobacter thereius]|uniref:Spermidine synthase n=3 Tax=Aliarcobacter thereius TaxID=544718 RepID=A0A1C0B9T7_9BACT|nr:spermidine synthase [Aliarcobacter thereius]OCL88528.1 Spermidine synthase [Aliarcobacter thereius]OCL92019.1 Spermidine synthase [Aliarcobacter thereius]OCL94885.1 Spermidine synthase [Aliarcobacter thereius LMG 24486]OCM00332.1 Spermidine synthase [Aliarcobacter thereius]QBF15241.1 spermidine synthase [Aliarcobacter thereius LMG 24486]
MQNCKIISEMMVHISLCTHIWAKDVLVLKEVNEELKTECEKHKKESSFLFEEYSNIENKENKSLDVVILNSQNIDFKVVSQMQRVLRDDGLVVVESSFYSKDIEKLKKDLQAFGEHFWIVMPFNFGHTTAIIASKKYHPTADLNLHRADFLEGMEYYSSDIHLASFVFPAKVHKELTGIAKR